jgi:hypothetical protein
VTISQRPAPIAKLVAVGEAPGHGDAAAKPIPVPTINRINVVAIATTAPAITGAQVTPERPLTDSIPLSRSIIVAMLLSSVPEEEKQKDNWDRNTYQPKQYRSHVSLPTYDRCRIERANHRNVSKNLSSGAGLDDHFLPPVPGLVVFAALPSSIRP